MKKLLTVLLVVGAAAALITALAGCPAKKPVAENSVMPPMSMPADKPMDKPAATTTENKPVAEAKEEMASCPVLGTTMPKKDMIPYDYKGKTYYFCCADCVTQFKADPEKWIKHPTPPKPAGQGMGM